MEKIKRFDSALMVEGLDLLADLSAYASKNGFEVYLGCGAVRDNVHGRLCKDFDMVVLGCPVEHQGGLMDIIMCNHPYDIKQIYGRDANDEYAKSFPGEEDRYDSIIQFESWEKGRKDVDLLFYTSAYKTMHDVAMSHDHTINQFAAWHGSLGLTVAYLGDPAQYGTCRQIRRGVSEERIAKMQEKAADLGWTYEAMPPEPEPEPEQDWDEFLDELLR